MASRRRSSNLEPIEELEVEEQPLPRLPTRQFLPPQSPTAQPVPTPPDFTAAPAILAKETLLGDTRRETSGQSLARKNAPLATPSRAGQELSDAAFQAWATAKDKKDKEIRKIQAQALADTLAAAAVISTEDANSAAVARWLQRKQAQEAQDRVSENWARRTASRIRRHLYDNIPTGGGGDLETKKTRVPRPATAPSVATGKSIQPRRLLVHSAPASFEGANTRSPILPSLSSPVLPRKEYLPPRHPTSRADGGR